MQKYIMGGMFLACQSFNHTFIFTIERELQLLHDETKSFRTPVKMKYITKAIFALGPILSAHHTSAAPGYPGPFVSTVGTASVSWTDPTSVYIRNFHVDTNADLVMNSYDTSSGKWKSEQTGFHNVKISEPASIVAVSTKPLTPEHEVYSPALGDLTIAHSGRFGSSTEKTLGSCVVWFSASQLVPGMPCPFISLHLTHTCDSVGRETKGFPI